MENKETGKHSTAPRASAGGVVLSGEGKLVLVEQFGNSWSFPKGGIESGESELQAARREIFEEAGLSDLELLMQEPLGTYERYSIGKDGISEATEYGLRRRTVFLFRANDNALVPHDSEVTEARWVSLDEALGLLTHPKDKEFLLSVRAKIEAFIKEDK